MVVVYSLLTALVATLAGPPPPQAARILAEPAVAVWRAPALVAPDGALRALPGWRVRIGLGGRAHLVGPAPRAPLPAAQWDDAADAAGVGVSVRVAARDAGAVYVEGRLARGRRARSFLLRWDAATGGWTEAASML